MGNVGSSCIILVSLVKVQVPCGLVISPGLEMQICCCSTKPIHLIMFHQLLDAKMAASIFQGTLGPIH
ncbi:hypothetical protein XENTR_v10017219 [Xenopus tropicalis]|nr:hypothetical protein XENTR_v10017219 [Xenopus tropicalis]